MSETVISPAVPPSVPQAAPAATPNVTAVASPTAATTTAKESGLHRFIDAIGSFFKKNGATMLKVATAAVPLLALTPEGPEYTLVVGAITSAVQLDAATQAASLTPLTDAQKIGLAVQVATPGLTEILASKGITTPATVNSAITNFVTSVFNIHAGPAVPGSVTSA